MAGFDRDFHSLICRVRQGSEDAAWELVNQYGGAVRRAVRRALNARLRSKFDSMDFVQLVWHSLFRVRNSLDRFDRPEDLIAYLVTMARNKVGMEQRRRLKLHKYNVNREQSLDQLQNETFAGIPDHKPMPVDVAIARERWERLLENQPPHYREIIHLRLLGETCESIADKIHVNECTVRRFLKKLLHASAP